MTDDLTANAAAFDAATTTDGPAGDADSLEQELASARRAVEKARAHLAAAEAELASLERNA